jgi:inhibitor of cysteine peptidase
VIARRNPRRPAIAAALCAIVLVATGHRMYRLTENDSGREVTITPGDAIELSLPENPTTGYRWSVQSDGEPVLGLESERFERTGSMPGRGGMHHWIFKALAPGSETLELIYTRPWEKVPPARTFTIKVRAGASSA